MADVHKQDSINPHVRVAILDDHRLIVEGLTAALDAVSPRMSVVAAATSWASLIEHPRMPADVVVIDLHLDDGILIGTKVRALAAMGCASVVMSRHSDMTSVNSAMQAGALAFIAKSDSIDELATAIRTAALGNTHLSHPRANALARWVESPDPGLGRQEQRALVLYAEGRSVHEVAAVMETTDETVKSYIKRARRKFREVGIDIGTRVLLRRHATREGWLSPE